MRHRTGLCGYCPRSGELTPEGGDLGHLHKAGESPSLPLKQQSSSTWKPLDSRGECLETPTLSSPCAPAGSLEEQWHLEVMDKGRVTCPTCRAVVRKTVAGLQKHMASCQPQVRRCRATLPFFLGGLWLSQWRGGGGGAAAAAGSSANDLCQCWCDPFCLEPFQRASCSPHKVVAQGAFGGDVAGKTMFSKLEVMEALSGGRGGGVGNPVF